MLLHTDRERDVKPRTIHLNLFLFVFTNPTHNFLEVRTSIISRHPVKFHRFRQNLYFTG